MDNQNETTASPTQVAADTAAMTSGEDLAQPNDRSAATDASGQVKADAVEQETPGSEQAAEQDSSSDDEGDVELPEEFRHVAPEPLMPRISEGPSAKVLSEDQSVQRAKFPPIEETLTSQAVGKIEYLKDVDLDASVELGNTVLTVEKILNLNVGSIIELNQTIGDQVRLLINGNPYACGEVVVIGDKFGVRITKLLH